MKRHRFIGCFDLKPGPICISEEKIVHQIWEVLKLRPPEEVVLCDGQGREAEAVVGERTAAGIELEIKSIASNTSEPTHQVSLYCAVLKKENFEMVCQKAVEAGATEIIPIVTERTIKLNLRADRLEKIIREAAEQSGRGVVPRLGQILDMAAAIEDAAKFDVKWLCDPSDQPIQSGQKPAKIAVFIGPEGGWSLGELKLAQQTGFAIVSLGPRVLRAETAAIIATYLAAK